VQSLPGPTVARIRARRRGYGCGFIGRPRACRPCPCPTWSGLARCGTWSWPWLYAARVPWPLIQDVFAQVGSFFATFWSCDVRWGLFAVRSDMDPRGRDRYGWLTTRKCIDALGLRNHTRSPDPGITQFVGFSGRASPHKVGHGRCSRNADALDDLCGLVYLDISRGAPVIWTGSPAVRD